MDAESSHDVRIRWVTPESEEQRLVTEVTDAQGKIITEKRWQPGPDEIDDYGDAQFEPLMAVSIIVGLGWLLKKVSETILDHRRPGGQLVDVRNPEDVIVRPLPAADRGTLVVIASTGTKVYPPDQHDDGLHFLSGVLRA